MIKDKFEIEIGKRLRSTQASVPVGSWDAIRAGMNSTPGLPVQNTAAFSNAGLIVGLVVGAAMFISLALYSGQEAVQHPVKRLVELKPESAPERKSPVTVVPKENETPVTTRVEVVEKSELVNESQKSELQKAETQNKSNIEVASRETVTFEPISANTDAEIASPNSQRQGIRKLASKRSTEDGKPATALQSSNGPAPEAKIMADRISGYAPLTVHFDNKGHGEKYYWEFGYMTESFDKAPEVIFDEPGVYMVYLSVENADGEIAEDYVQVSVKEGSKFYIQDAFTPNGDGKNDTYKINGASNIAEFYMVITDQNDNTVFESRDINREWNYDQSVHGQVGAKYFVTYRAVGIDGKVYSENRKALHILY